MPAPLGDRVEDGAEVAAPDGRSLVAKECRPSLARRRAAKAGQIALDGALGDVDTELEQLAANALAAE
jgi:hypothetical protein